MSLPRPPAYDRSRQRRLLMRLLIQRLGTRTIWHRWGRVAETLPVPALDRPVQRPALSITFWPAATRAVINLRPLGIRRVARARILNSLALQRRLLTM